MRRPVSVELLQRSMMMTQEIERSVLDDCPEFAEENVQDCFVFECEDVV